MEFIAQIVNVVSMLLRDRSPQVIKRVIQACGSIYKNGMHWLCSQEENELTESAEQAWNILSLIKAQILDLIDNDNDGIRTNAIKFLEGVVILQSHPDDDTQKKGNDFSLDNIPDKVRIFNKRKLEEEAMNIFDILLKFHAATHISSVNLITCTSSLSTIAKLRPSNFMGSVVEAFKSLNNNLPPTLTDSQISSVRKNLKMQLLSLLKNKGSYEFQLTIKHQLIDLGGSANEIQRAIPKYDKQEQMRRQKRILENAANNFSKRIRMRSVSPQKDDQTYMDVDEEDDDQDYDDDDDDNDDEEDDDYDNSTILKAKRPEMEIDEDEMKKQMDRSTKVNEKFIGEHLRDMNVVSNLVLEFLPKIPSTMPENFQRDFVPIRDISISQQVTRVSHMLGEQMTAQKLGPGAAVLSKTPPMRRVPTPKRKRKIAKKPIIEDTMVHTVNEEEEKINKRLRENIERLKGEQEVIERMKQKAKALKLQEITKPLNRQTKEKHLMDAIERILNSERQCNLAGVAAKRRHIITVIAATFPDNARHFIFDFIMQDIKRRIDLAFSWLYEEYCLLQGFTRHSYVKSENRPDYAFNEFLAQLVHGIIEKCDFRDKVILLRKVFIQTPILPDEIVKPLEELIFEEEFTIHGLDLLKDLIIYKPPKRNRLLTILLTLCVHYRLEVNAKALAVLGQLYKEQEIVRPRIDIFVLEWAMYMKQSEPPAAIFRPEYGQPSVSTVWLEELAKICLNPLLTVLPYNCGVYLEKLSEIYVATGLELKRTILRALDKPIQQIGTSDAHLLKFIENCPKGCETVIIRLIYILTISMPTPHPELMSRVKNLHTNKLKDVRILIPILHGLTRQEIINILPKLIKLNPMVVREVFNRLLCLGTEFAQTKVNITPAEILVALHNIDINDCDVKCIVKAISYCLMEKTVYTEEVLMSVLQQLVEITPTPTLLMRTVIQSLTIYPRLNTVVLNLLPRLINKKVWLQKVIWDGFLKCLQRLKPKSIPIMLQLPPAQLLNALEQCPELRQPLLEHAQSVEKEPLSGVTTQIMNIITGKTTDVFVTVSTTLSKYFSKFYILVLISMYLYNFVLFCSILFIRMTPVAI